MLTWIGENISTILISIVLAAVVAGIIVSMTKNKKKGKSSCGCGCEHCAMSGACHSKKRS